MAIEPARHESSVVGNEPAVANALTPLAAAGRAIPRDYLPVASAARSRVEDADNATADRQNASWFSMP